jgi:hypothetical protein
MKWRYKNIQDAGKDLAKSSRNNKGNTSREDDESQLPRNRQSRSQNRNRKSKEQKRGRGSPRNKKSRRINNGERNKHKDGCKHCGGRPDSKDCWELTENKDKRPDWWRPPEKRGNHNNTRGKRNKKEKTEQSNKIKLSKEAFVRLVCDAQKGCKNKSMEADNSKDDMDSIRNTAKYYKNMHKSHSNNVTTVTPLTRCTRKEHR